MKYAKHFSFLILKVIQGYQTSSVIEYDYGVCDQLEYSDDGNCLQKSSVDLMNWYLELAQRCQGSTRESIPG